MLIIIFLLLDFYNTDFENDGITQIPVNHHKENEITSKEQSCIVCGKIFSSLNDVISHLNKHSAVELGENSGHSIVNITDGIQGSQNGNNNVIYGDKEDIGIPSTSNIHNMLNEKLNSKNNLRVLFCGYCDETYDNLSSIMIHVRSHSVKFSSYCYCNICNKTFVNNFVLGIHVKSHQKDNVCLICNKYFSGHSEIINHMNLHSEKTHSYTMCGQSFRVLSELALHIRIHSDEKPYKYEICMKSFTNPSGLVTHSRSHTGEKPYQCVICQKSYTRNANLKKHMRTHTAEN